MNVIKQYLKTIIISVIVVVLISVVISMLLKPGPYMSQDDYMSVFGIKGLYSYNEIKSEKNAEVISEILDSNGWVTLVFDGYTIQFTPDKSLGNIKITSPKYQLGRMKICVGGSDLEIKRAYNNHGLVNDTDINVIGYIDGYTHNASDDSHMPWVFFELDDNSRVKKITVCPIGIF